jgi:predicted TIM-barrel fold metal-dependent hydrolase
MNHADCLIAIDIHTHAEVSCWNPFDNYGEEYDRAADKYFGSQPPSHHRRDRGLLPRAQDRFGDVHGGQPSRTWGVAAFPTRKSPRPPRDNSDMMMAFASIDPHKGKMGAREAERLIKEEGVRGLQVPPHGAGLPPLRQDGLADLRGDQPRTNCPPSSTPATAALASGMRCGGGLRLAYSNPMHLDDVAIDWPDMQIVMAHPSFPLARRGAVSVAMHKPNVWIDLSGWSPKYFPKQLVQYANTLLKDRVLFGSDYPLITPERWMKDFEVAGFKPEVMPGILKDNAVRLLGLA